jgi:hypothetical protein
MRLPLIASGELAKAPSQDPMAGLRPALPLLDRQEFGAG